MTITPTLKETAAVERHQGAARALPIVTGGTSSALALMTDFTDTVRQVESFVNALVDTPFVPEAHWPLPVGVKAWEMPNKSARMRHARESEQDWQVRRQIACASGTGAVLTGLPLGLDPLVALSQVFVVKGRPGLYTKIKLALAQARGHDVWDVERSDIRAVVAGRRRGWPAERFVEITVTIEEAERAGWTDNDTYTKTPADMLWNRATSRVLDRIAADVLFGIASIEDLELDDVPDRSTTRPAVQAAAPAETARAASSAVLASALEAAARRGEQGPGAALQGEPPEAAAAAAPAESAPMDEREWRRINGRFVELGVIGIGQAGKRLQIIGDILGRQITHGRELSAQEADFVLANLAGLAGERAVARVLGEDEPGAATQEDVEAEADELLGEGRAAALEGVVDPWGEQ